MPSFYLQSLGVQYPFALFNELNMDSLFVLDTQQYQHHNNLQNIVVNAILVCGTAITPSYCSTSQLVDCTPGDQREMEPHDEKVLHQELLELNKGTSSLNEDDVLNHVCAHCVQSDHVDLTEPVSE